MLVIRGMRQEGARIRNQQSNQKIKLASGKRAKKLYLRQNILDKYGRSVGCPGCVGIGQHTAECRARIEQEMVDKGDAVKIGASEEIVQEPDDSVKKRKIGEPDINPGGASSVTADTPKRSESEQGASAEKETELAGCMSCGSQQTVV